MNKWKSPEYRRAIWDLIRAMSRSIYSSLGLGLLLTSWCFFQVFGQLLDTMRVDGVGLVVFFITLFFSVSGGFFLLMLFNRYRMLKKYGHLPMNMNRPINRAMQTLIDGPQTLQEANETFHTNEAKRQAQAGNLSISVEADHATRGGLALAEQKQGGLSMQEHTVTDEQVAFEFDEASDNEHTQAAHAEQSSKS